MLFRSAPEERGSQTPRTASVFCRLYEDFSPVPPSLTSRLRLHLCRSPVRLPEPEPEAEAFAPWHFFPFPGPFPNQDGPPGRSRLPRCRRPFPLALLFYRKEGLLYPLSTLSFLPEYVKALNGRFWPYPGYRKESLCGRFPAAGPTSGYKTRGVCGFPNFEQIQRYYDLGGRIITIGSDSHTSDRVGEHVEDVIKEYQHIGFQDVSTFTKRVRD